MGEALQLINNQNAMSKTERKDRIELWKSLYCKGATDLEAKLFLSVCHRTGLDPESRQIYAVLRWDSKQNRNILTPQVSIDGLRLIAQRSGKYQGQIGPAWCGKDGIWKEAWLEDTPPMACKVAVLREGFTEPMYAIATWKSYAQRNKDGKLMGMWKKYPDLMLSKCAESLALRKSFPHETSGIYTEDEMPPAEPQATTKVPPKTTSTPPKRQELPPQQSVTPGMLKDMFTLLEASNYTQEGLKAYLLEQWGYTSTKQLRLKEFQEICQLIKRDMKD